MTRDAELELEAELEDLVRTLSEGDLESEDEWEGDDDDGTPPARCTPVGTRVGNFTCSLLESVEINRRLRQPIPYPALRDVVESAAAQAVSFVTTAADLLEIGNRTRLSRVAFCAAFGVPPGFVPSWRATLRGAKWRDLGELVAVRLRRVAESLDSGCIKYFCWGSPRHCPNCTVSPERYFGCSFRGRHEICLGHGFWQAWRAGNTDMTLLHEAMHINFGATVVDSGRTNNASCYESYVLRVNGLPVSNDTSQACPTGACAPGPPIILDRFRFGSPQLQPHHAAIIHQIAQLVVSSWQTSSPYRVLQLTGFTDSTGRDPYNLGLGLDRANAVRDGIAAEIRSQDPAVAQQVVLMPLTLGRTAAIATNATAVGRARNRRVEVILLPGVQ